MDDFDGARLGEDEGTVDGFSLSGVGGEDGTTLGRDDGSAEGMLLG